jgi:predicted metal-dependent enzyme (double-stranded beta helix superfamily)
VNIARNVLEFLARAVSGIYSGCGDNVLCCRLSEETEGAIEAVGVKSLSEKDRLALGADVIHSVVNPIPRMSGAIHVYGGDVFAVQRAGPGAAAREALDMRKVLAMPEQGQGDSPADSSPFG